MWLLNTERVELEFFIDEIPPYAILSHTWEQEEVIFQDMEQGQAKDKKGYAKIKNCCSIAHDNGYNYVWIDTCCIDNPNPNPNPNQLHNKILTMDYKIRSVLTRHAHFPCTSPHNRLMFHRTIKLSSPFDVW
ncbi:hypothetical protein CDV31_004050 [Fusarium ambrosium]|uniref:Heterokaryon incompatibility domain-containing protein n=1 Tax=Fusarium ambrosium TaxID=131363 RepID=A0A428USB8_9HYPO|nr:hypothetical protein CDV31_004050 [Fusarium ambrosium]